jgi:DnaJ-class molecular chaperone
MKPTEDVTEDVFVKLAAIQRHWLRVRRVEETVRCGYCRGTGRDFEFGTSRCPVCGGTGKVQVPPPTVTCLRCLGSGREWGKLTCLACRGTGVASVPETGAICPDCAGTGEEGVLYCLPCRGQGIVIESRLLVW